MMQDSTEKNLAYQHVKPTIMV